MCFNDQFFYCDILHNLKGQGNAASEIHLIQPGLPGLSWAILKISQKRIQDSKFCRVKKNPSKIKSTIHWWLLSFLVMPPRQLTFHSSSATSFFRPSKLSMKVLLKEGRSKSCTHDSCSVTQQQRYSNSVRHSRGNVQHTWIKPFTWSSILTTGFCSFSLEEVEEWDTFRVLVYIACYFMYSVVI